MLVHPGFFHFLNMHVDILALYNVRYEDIDVGHSGDYDIRHQLLQVNYCGVGIFL